MESSNSVVDMFTMISSRRTSAGGLPGSSSFFGVPRTSGKFRERPARWQTSRKLRPVGGQDTPRTTATQYTVTVVRKPLDK